MYTTYQSTPVNKKDTFSILKFTKTEMSACLSFLDSLDPMQHNGPSGPLNRATDVLNAIEILDYIQYVDLPGVKQVFFSLLPSSKDLKVLFSELEYRMNLFYRFECFGILSQRLRAEVLAELISHYSQQETSIHDTLTNEAPIDKLFGLFQINTLSFRRT